MVTKLIQNNFTKGRNGQRISHIVVHINGGNTRDWSAFEWFNNPNQKYANGTRVSVSTHYGILTSGGKERYVNDSDTAHHAGTEGWNYITIGIEFNDVLTDASYKAGAELIAELCKTHGIECSRTFIVTHREVLVSAFGNGVTLTCSNNLDVDRLVREAKVLLTPQVITNNEELNKLKNEYEKQRAEYEAKILQTIEVSKAEKELLNVKIQNLQKDIEIKDTEISELKTVAQNAFKLDLGVNTELVTTIAEESVNVDGFLTKYANFIDSRVKSQTLRSILKYDLFVYVGTVLGTVSLVLLFPKAPSELITIGALLQGIVYKLLLTRYDTNKDGKLDKSDFQVIK